MAFSSQVKNTFHRLRKSHLAIALLLALVLILWLASGIIFRAETDAPKPNEDAPKQTLPRVETRVLQAQNYAPEQVAQGQLLPLREVEIRSQISAHLSERKVQLGDWVEAGDKLFQLNQENREAQLARAEADLTLARAELRAAQRLREGELMSETDFLRVQAMVAAAVAEREALAQQLDYTRIVAPFAGIVDRLPVEEGDFVQVGQSIATLVDIATLELSAFVPQQQVHALRPGLNVEVTLLDGTRLPGTLTYVASRAESSTRSFRIEAKIDNPDLRRIAGSSATIAIHLSPRQAHRLSPALLVLEDDGVLGVKVVDQNQRVAFVAVDILGFDPAGVWVGGLADNIELITLGGGFVDQGELVNPTKAEAP